MRLLEPNVQNGISLREAFSRMADDGRNLPSLPVDVLENANSIVVKAQIPGSSKEQIEIHFEKDVLTVKAELPAEDAPEGGRFLLKERAHGTVTRTFRLPFPVDPEQASAGYQDGLLTLTMPKLESAKPRQIAIQ